jgi:beta-lactamase class A
MKTLLDDKINSFQGTIAVGFKDLLSSDEFYYNEIEIFPAASIIKIPIMIEFFRQVERKKIHVHQKIILKEKYKAGGAGILFELHNGVELTLLDLAKLMIVISDNTATNLLLDYTGFDGVNNLMKEAGMTSSCLRRKMMVPYKDDQENLISMRDIMLLMEKLVTGKLLSSEYTCLSVEILKRQQYNEKIPLYLPENLSVAHKTGEINGVRHDVAAIYIHDRIYLLSVLTKNVLDVIETDRITGEISKIIYEKVSGKIEK